MKFNRIASKFAPSITILIVAACGFIYFVQPFKVTDPSDQRFNPDHFRFSDYSNAEFRELCKILFPVGTPETLVDRVLVDAGGARKNIDRESNGRIVIYDSGWLTAVRHDVVYDENRKLINMNPLNGISLYPNQPTRDDIWKEHK